ncbi:MAG: sulfoxide reductase heme-binding subunit YedZ [Chloroflexi bacterium]|nr:sulfoxide reductase heme-binding subunit YedZ [Chloroflexota bacterium]
MNLAFSTPKRKTNRKIIGRWLRAATHIGSLLPLAWLVWQFFQNDLGTDPVREIILRTGKLTIIWLMLSLAVTPLNKLFGWKQIIPLRKPLGLYAFLYVSLHLTTFVWLDYGLNWKFILDGIFEQPYVIIGFIAYLLLIPLAATSTKWAMRRLGKNWKRLHKLVYLIGVLGVIHFFWLVKVYTRPIMYGSVMALLLLTRVGPVKRQLLRWRSSLQKMRK